MEEFGKVQPEGGMAFAGVSVRLRAPRVAVLVDVAKHWQSRFALAMAQCSEVWGGQGFIYVPHTGGVIDRVLAKVLRAYDPDYVVEAVPTVREFEALEPGWLAAQVQGMSAGSPEYANYLASMGGQRQRSVSGLLEAASRFCQPYYEEYDQNERHRRHVELAAGDHGPLTGRSAFVGTQRPSFEVPDELDAITALAVGMRTGFTRPPRLPVGFQGTGVVSVETEPYVAYALFLGPMRECRVPDGLLGAATAWGLTKTGLHSVGRVRPTEWRPLVVVGSAPEDYALAVALDRMYGPALWLPEEWVTEDSKQDTVTSALLDLVGVVGYGFGGPLLVSTSLDERALQAVIDSHEPGSLGVGLERGQGDGDRPIVGDVRVLELGDPMHLACAGDYDNVLTLASRHDGSGGIDLLAPIPAVAPKEPSLQGQRRPFWEVDVELFTARTPAGDVPGSLFLASEGNPFPPRVRGSHAGISFNPMNMGFVPSNATLAQSISTPTLRFPGLQEWVTAAARTQQPDASVRPSQAGVRAMIAARLWGSRSALAADLDELAAYLRAFTPGSTRRDQAYPDGDGFPLQGGEAVLTLAAADRLLLGQSPERVREKLDELVRRGILTRGLVLRCEECERWEYYRLGVLTDSNTCRRCGAQVRPESGWMSSREPAWFYDLHGAIRELIKQNGDVPLLASRHLATTARSYEDVAELDIVRAGAGAGAERAELDLVATVDGRLVVGEAKIKPVIDQGKRHSTVAKLVHAADALGADEILLASGATGEWNAGDLSALKQGVVDGRWRNLVQPRIRVLTGLSTSTPSDALLDLGLPTACSTKRR